MGSQSHSSPFSPTRARLPATMDTSPIESVGVVATATASQPIELPNWLTAPEPPAPKPSREMRDLIVLQYESAFPRILERMYSGSTLQAAIDDDFREIDSGAFLRWIRKDPERHALYKEAKEIRTEAWAGKIIEHAVASDSAEDVQRSKLIVDTYKWLMAADNRRTYGDTKQIDFGGTISITAALAQAQARVVEAEVIELSTKDDDAEA